MRYEDGAVGPHVHGIYPPNVFKLVDAAANTTGLR
jgi:zinc/manganese transport system substrate-binding protein